MNQTILHIRAGGTVDSKRYEADHELTEKDLRNPPMLVKPLSEDESLLSDVIGSLHNGEKVKDFSWQQHHIDETNFSKDSQAYTDADVERLAEIIRQDDMSNVMITHGTDAVVKNASKLKKLLGDTDKTIIFACAMIPLSMSDIKESDGIEIMQYTLNNIEHQPRGVYVTAYDPHTKILNFHEPKTIEKDRRISKEQLKFFVKQVETSMAL